MSLGLEPLELQGVYRLQLSGEQTESDAGDQRRIAKSARMLAEATLDSLGQAHMPNPLSIRWVVPEMLEAGPGSHGLWAGDAGADAFGTHAGTRHDPVILQALTNALGLWPAGTILDPADGRAVQVVGSVRTPETWDRPPAPWVRLAAAV